MIVPRDGVTSRVETVKGRRVLVVERQPPLPPRLDLLIGSMVVTERHDITPTGARLACTVDRDHRLALLRAGRHLGLDGIARDLKVSMCQDCGAVCVRDVSLDVLPIKRQGRGGPRRRDMVLGWYSGARPNSREYR